MPDFTTFLELTLPELNEFLNKWHEPVNQNNETIDDWLSDLNAALVGSGASSAWTSLVGSMANLAERLDVSINADGTIDVAGTPGVLEMATSAVRGASASPSARLNAGDFEAYAGAQPVVGGRFVPMPFAGPTAAFPPETMASAMALSSADFSGPLGNAIPGPFVPWAPGLMMGGANPLISGLAIGQVRITADAPAAIFNIDGYIFRLREIIDLDWNLLAPPDLSYVWVYVSRVEADYGNANFRYKGPGGVIAVKDLRTLQSGADGVASTSTFTSATGLFNTALLGKVKQGDTLVITNTAAAGEYVINALDGTTPDTKFTIKGLFPAAASGASWYIRDNWHPTIGAVVTDTDPTTLPAQVAGRVYIARFKHNVAIAPSSALIFAKGGVFDSGWLPVDASTDFPKTIIHNLGTYPSDVQVWFRVDATSNRQYRGVVQRQIVTTVDESDTTLDPGDTKTTTLLVPSVYVHTSEINVTVQVLNVSSDPAYPDALFTDSSNVDQTAGEMRVIARR